MNKSDILLETGTNELEVLEFIIAGNSFGINVAKVRELRQYENIQIIPHSHPNIEGIIKPRDEIFTIVDLAGYLGLPASENTDHDIFIVAGFNKMNLAFHVHDIKTIHRLSWQSIEKPDVTIFGGTEGVVTGIAKCDGRMISIIDFEKIVYDISPLTGIQYSEIDDLGQRPNSEKPILIAEDSLLLRNMILESLHRAGYTKVTATDNGEECWNKINEYREAGILSQSVSAVITDIEMPKMDGMRLTKLIKDDKELGNIPVVIFSSLIDVEMRRKGEEVGANAQLSKPEIGHLVAVLDAVIEGRAVPEFV